ncbi:MAG TPA: 7-carboxy-7-deazaguanine synthase QueE [Bryobacteraceae bacterium]|nr:7-carboxy-7-deazaguanine synthase QueE [Bryobacteraceae bacterium]
MKIAELFYSLQGEGALLGVPSVFIRTSGCNLRCAWCDTPYTSWQPEGVDFSLDRILDEVNAHPARHVVITGGEPMIAPEIIALTGRLRQAGLHITVETAGTVFQPVACDLMSISPKLANSTPLAGRNSRIAGDPQVAGRWAAQHDRLRINLEVLRNLMDRYDYQLKFVIEKTADLDELRELVSALSADPGRVVLMPEGTDRDLLRERGAWLAEIAKAEGFRFTPRLHVELWGNRRGV